MTNIIISNKSKFKKYLWIRGIVLFLTIISILILAFVRLNKEINVAHASFQNIPLLLIFLFILFEKIESPFFLQISEKDNVLKFESFFPSFGKNVIFLKKNIKCMDIEVQDFSFVKEKRFGFIPVIRFIINRDDGFKYVSNSFNIKWLNKNDVLNITRLVENYN